MVVGMATAADLPALTSAAAAAGCTCRCTPPYMHAARPGVWSLTRFAWAWCQALLPAVCFAGPGLLQHYLAWVCVLRLTSTSVHGMEDTGLCGLCDEFLLDGCIERHLVPCERQGPLFLLLLLPHPADLPRHSSLPCLGTWVIERAQQRNILQGFGSVSPADLGSHAQDDCAASRHLGCKLSPQCLCRMSAGHHGNGLGCM